MKDDPYLLQQCGIYERIRSNGNLRLARSLLERARDKEPRDSTIIHTLATIVRSQAEDSQKPLERAKLRNEARTLLQQIEPGAGSAARYALVTRLNLATDELKELLTAEHASDRGIDEAIRVGESILEIARQRYPGDSYISVAESELAKLLEDHERSVEALKRARKANPRDPFHRIATYGDFRFERRTSPVQERASRKRSKVIKEIGVYGFSMLRCCASKVGWLVMS